MVIYFSVVAMFCNYNGLRPRPLRGKASPSAPSSRPSVGYIPGTTSMVGGVGVLSFYGGVGVLSFYGGGAGTS